MNIFPVCMYVRYIHAWFQQKPEEGTKPHRTGVLDRYVSPFYVLGSKPRAPVRTASALNY